MTRQTYDWTFTTKFKGSLSPTDVQIEKTEDKIPIELLTRPDPILFYDDVVLFEDELADNGSAIVHVKLRVMPSCFFSLQRFFLRVDDVCFRIIEIRLFHQFGQNFLLREYQERYSTSEALVESNKVFSVIMNANIGLTKLQELLADKGKFCDQNLLANLLPVQECYVEKISIPSS